MALLPPNTPITRQPFGRFAVKVVLAVLSLFLSILLLAPSSSHAEERKTPFCLHTEPLAPNGVIVRMGDEYYRTCGSWSDKGLRWRRFLLKMNPALVPDLFSTFPPTSLTINENIEGLDRMARATNLKPRRGTRVFGGVEYRSFESETLGPNGKPNAGTYIYHSKGPDDEVPTHWVSCNGWGHYNELHSLFCHVHVSKGDVTANLMLIGNKDRGYAFVDHFAKFAQDIERTLDVANVTEKIEEMTRFLEVIE